MKFYLAYYNNILNKPSYKHVLNIFFLKNNFGLPLNHTKYPHFFINTKNLKIKFLKNNSVNLYWSFIIFLVLSCFISALLFFVF